MKRYEGIELLRQLCLLFGPSGCEDNVADFIADQISDSADRIYRDRLGNLIAVIESGIPNSKKIMISAHMDEVGFMVNEITDDGYLKFDTVGGIDPRVLCGKNVTVGDEKSRISGIITSKAIHHKKKEEQENVTPISSMYIDVGASGKDDLSGLVDIGSYATFDSEFYTFGSGGKRIKSKALDDRLGCAVMIEILRSLFDNRKAISSDLYFCFTVREEIGISGAQVVAQSIFPDFAIVLETTAVADVSGVGESSRVAALSEGGAISLMDRSTIYDRELVNFALDVAKEKNIKAQIKKYVSGGNDSAHIHKSGYGVRTLALSAPTRYLHSPACVADLDDYRSMIDLVREMLSNWKFD